MVYILCTHRCLLLHSFTCITYNSICCLSSRPACAAFAFQNIFLSHLHSNSARNDGVAPSGPPAYHASRSPRLPCFLASVCLMSSSWPLSNTDLFLSVQLRNFYQPSSSPSLSSLSLSTDFFVFFYISSVAHRWSFSKSNQCQIFT